MPADLKWYNDSAGTTPATEVDWGSLAVTEESAERTLYLINDGDETATDVRITTVERALVGDDPDQDGQATLERWSKVKLTGTVGGTGITAQTTAYTPTGKGRYLRVNEIPAGAYREVKWKAAIPAGAVATTQRYLSLAVDWDKRSTPLEEGHLISGARGVGYGIGDRLFTEVISGGVITANSPEDNKVNVADVVWIYQGTPKSKLDHEITLAAASAGNAYWATLSVGAGSTITSTTSTEETAPAPTSSREEVPAGERLLGYVHVDDSATIATADIYQADLVYGWYHCTTSGLTATIHRGVGLVDDFLTDRDATTDVALSATATNTIYQLPDGSFEKVTSGDPSDLRAEPLWEITTDGSGETARQDLRRWMGAELRAFQFRFDSTLTGSDTSQVLQLPFATGGYVRALEGVVAALDDQGSGLSSGQSVFEVEYSDGGGSWTTLFTSAGTPESRPLILYTAWDDSDAVPEVFTLPGFCRLRATCVAIPSGGTAPGGAVVTLLVHEK